MCADQTLSDEREDSDLDGAMNKDHYASGSSVLARRSQSRNVVTSIPKSRAVAAMSPSRGRASCTASA